MRREARRAIRAEARAAAGGAPGTTKALHAKQPSLSDISKKSFGKKFSRNTEAMIIAVDDKVLNLIEEIGGIPKFKTVSEREDWILGMMCAGKWPDYPMSIGFTRRLGEAWGLCYSAVGLSIATARKIVALSGDDREAIREQLGRRFLSMAEKAESTPATNTGLPDWKSAQNALELGAKYLGATPPEKAATGQVEASAEEQSSVLDAWAAARAAKGER